MFTNLRNEDGRLGMSSLSPKSLINIPTGISSLDAILGSGYPLGTLVLIEEDEYGFYSRIFSKCFLSEGIVNSDSVFLACREEDPKNKINDLPQPVLRREDIVPLAAAEELKIAWRYQNNQQVMSIPGSHKISHEYDFSTKLREETIKNSDVTTWPSSQSGHSLEELFDEIFKLISLKKSHIGKESKDKRKFIRIVIESLGSPFWCFDKKSLFQFLFKLRTVVHNSSSVAVVTIPSKLLECEMINTCKQLSDIVILLKSFMNTNDSSLTEYSGLIKFLKISAVNSFSIHVPEDVDWAFKAKKKKIIIEKLHLPPETGITDQREQDDLASISLPNCKLNF